jgi:hypothetical protein
MIKDIGTEVLRVGKTPLELFAEGKTAIITATKPTFEAVITDLCLSMERIPEKRLAIKRAYLRSLHTGNQGTM